MIALLAAGVAVYVVGLILLVGVLDCIRVPRHQRLGLVMTAAGLMWAGPARWQQGPGFADLLFVTGLAVQLTALYGPALIKRAGS